MSQPSLFDPDTTGTPCEGGAVVEVPIDVAYPGGVVEWLRDQWEPVTVRQIADAWGRSVTWARWEINRMQIRGEALCVGHDVHPQGARVSLWVAT